jgi:hypothetical protein
VVLGKPQVWTCADGGASSIPKKKNRYLVDSGSLLSVLRFLPFDGWNRNRLAQLQTKLTTREGRDCDDAAAKQSHAARLWNRPSGL